MTPAPLAGTVAMSTGMTVTFALLMAVILWRFLRWRRRWQRHAPADRRPAPRIALALAGLLFLLLSLGGAIRPEEGKPRRLMLVLDTSGSMAAGDLTPSRFGVMLAEAGELLAQAGEGEIGIVEMNSTASLILAPTPDRGAARAALDALAEAGPAGGSDLDNAIALAAGTLVPEAGRVVLFTDGERDRSPIADLTKRLREHAIRLDIRGVGTPQGAPLTGKPEPARLNESALRQLAEESGGTYRRLGQADNSHRPDDNPRPRLPVNDDLAAAAAFILLALAALRGLPW